MLLLVLETTLSKRALFLHPFAFNYSLSGVVPLFAQAEPSVPTYVTPHPRRLIGPVLTMVVLLGGCAGSDSTSFAPRCAKPNVAAQVRYTAFPDEPPIAIQQGLTGNVEILVGLDNSSKVLTATVKSSPSELLDAAAIDAARKSSYSTAIVNCAAVPSNVVFVAAFPPAQLPPPGP